MVFTTLCMAGVAAQFPLKPETGSVCVCGTHLELAALKNRLEE